MEFKTVNKDGPFRHITGTYTEIEDAVVVSSLVSSKVRLKLGAPCAVQFTRLFVCLTCSSCPSLYLDPFPLLSLGLTF